MNPMFDRYYMNPKALVRDKESGASAKVHAKPKRKGGRVQGTGQWAGKDVPGMYKNGGENKNMLKNSKGDISVKKTGVKKGPDISVKPGKSSKYTTKDLKNSPGVKNLKTKKVGQKVGKRIAKQIAKKLGPVGVAYTAYDILKDPQGALDQLRTDVKNVKNFIKGNKGKSETPKKKTTSKKKDTRPNYIKKRDKDYTPQSRKK